MSRHFLFTNGIRQKVNEFRSWHLEAERWIENNRGDRDWSADTFSYHVKATTRWLYHPDLVEECGSILSAHHTARPQDELIGVGHSWGTGVLADVLRDGWVRFDELHLIASALTSDMEKNGLAPALREGRVGQVHLYCSPDDEALKLGRLSKLWSWLAPNRLGYGQLGLTGPTNADRATSPGTLHVHWRHGFKHSDWFAVENFGWLMRMVTNSGRE